MVFTFINAYVFKIHHIKIFKVDILMLVDNFKVQLLNMVIGMLIIVGLTLLSVWCCSLV